MLFFGYPPCKTTSSQLKKYEVHPKKDMNHLSSINFHGRTCCELQGVFFEFVFFSWWLHGLLVVRLRLRALCVVWRF